MFGGFFKDKTFLDPEDEAWHLESWAWFLTHFDGLGRFRQTRLVKANREFFPSSEAEGHARAEHVFACVKRLAGMTEWPCTLVAQPKRPEAKVAEFTVLKTIEGHLPLGTFQARDGEVTITYDPDSLHKPAMLVATLAHELAHYLIAARRGELPGGEEMHEYLTDLMTVFMGFGLFNANAAFNFSQFTSALSQGWQSSRQGYLRERDWAFALAVYAILQEKDVKLYAGDLKPHLYADIREAMRYLAKHPGLLAPLREIKTGPEAAG